MDDKHLTLPQTIFPIIKQSSGKRNSIFQPELTLDPKLWSWERSKQRPSIFLTPSQPSLTSFPRLGNLSGKLGAARDGLGTAN